MDAPIAHTVKINLPGGVVSTGDLCELLTIAEKCDAEAIRIGNRQQLYFKIPGEKLYDLEFEMLKAEISYETDTHEFPNIVSSYVTDSIFSSDSWLKEGVYKDIFDLFNFKPKLKINLADSRQTFTPFFSGNLNFIASEISNYWYWYIRFPQTNHLFCWPSLIYSADIAGLCKIAEKIILSDLRYRSKTDENSQADFLELINQHISLFPQQITQPLILPEFSLPYYEGFNSTGNDRHWLGLYQRNEQFSISLLKDICKLCLDTRIGQVYSTPWKSLIIKGINKEHLEQWRSILDRHRINVRHSYNELNWQLENLCKESLDLKKRIVRDFEDHDIRTYKLCFAIKMQPRSGLMGSIVLKRRTSDLFDIFHTADFNPNSKDFVLYRAKLSAEELSKVLMDLCDLYYSGLQIPKPVSPSLPAEDISFTAPVHTLYQCDLCMSIYDQTYGDPFNGIPPMTDFETLEEYICPVCESDKQHFFPLNV